MPQGISQAVVLRDIYGTQSLITGASGASLGDHHCLVCCFLLVSVRTSRLIKDTPEGLPLSAPRNSFFLPPYTSLMEFMWSAYTSPVRLETCGASRGSCLPHEARQVLQDPVPKVNITMIDLRAQKMFFQNEAREPRRPFESFFEVQVRTSDNVRLKLEGTIFWQVRDVMQMVATTSDAPGDISQRARSGMIQEVGRLTLANFMAGFNNLTKATYDSQAADTFYSDRGVELQSLEITRFDSVDNETALVLQNIIKETTLRINELQKQESLNAVNAAKLSADIQLEQQRTQLIQTQASQKIEREM